MSEDIKTIKSIDFNRLLCIANEYCRLGYTVTSWDYRPYKFLFWTTYTEYTLVMKLSNTSNKPSPDNWSLESQLERAISNEHYELAAFLRDQIAKQNNISD
jgi:hypothetical protein